MTRSRGTLGNALPAIGFVALALMPQLLNNFRLSQLSLFLCLAGLALALDLAWGQAGILSLGHAAFFGIGAYAMAIVTTRPALGGSMVVAVLAAIGIAVAFAIVLGWFAFGGGVAGPFLAILTLAVSLLLEQVALQWKSLTGGFDGIFGIAPLTLDPINAYYICAGGLLIMYMVGRFVASGPLGLVLAALRDNETRAQFSGYNPVSYQTVVFAISAGLAGFAGALYAQQSGFVSPSLLGFDLSVQVAVWVVLGGRATLVGAAIGAILINSIHDSLPDSALDDYQLVLGSVFIAVVLLLPRGIYGTLLQCASRVRIRRAGPRSAPGVMQPDDVPAVSHTGSAALETRGVAKSFGALSVLNGVDLAVRTGDLKSLIGPNGAGKTTFLNVVTGALRPGEGDVVVFGTATKGLRPHRLVARGVGRKFQTPSIFHTLTVQENVVVATWGKSNRWPALLGRLVKPTVYTDAMELLASSGLALRSDTLAADLSHGERQTLELAMVLAGRPRLLLLDEPTAGLTARETEAAARMLRRLAESRALTIVAIEHDMGFVRAFYDSVTVLHRGKVLADGTLEETQGNEEVRNAYLGAAT